MRRRRRDAASMLAEALGKRSIERHAALVYFIAAPDIGRVKIGTTRNLPGRLALLAKLAPCPLELIRTLPGDRDVEAAVHQRFAAHRAHGEWFELAHIRAEIESMVGSSLPAEFCRTAEQMIRALADTKSNATP